MTRETPYTPPLSRVSDLPQAVASPWRWPAVLSTAVPWLLVAIGWLAFHTGFSGDDEQGHVFGTEADWEFMGIFTVAWLCWGVALAVSAMALRGSTHRSLLWACTVINGSAFVLPVLIVIWLVVASSYAL
jgi:hypothetical protein